MAFFILIACKTDNFKQTINKTSEKEFPQAIDVITEAMEFQIFDSISSGWNTFKVNYLDQVVHENFVGHDVNIAKLDDSADVDELEAWMNWATPTGLMTPAPDGVTFLGGTNDAPADTS